MTSVHFLIPRSSPQTASADAVPADAYVRGVAAALCAQGMAVTVDELQGCYPMIDDRTVIAADIMMACLPDKSVVVIDGLALPGVAASLFLESHRLCLVALIQKPLHAGVEPAHLLRHLEQAALARMRRVIATTPRTARAVIALGVPRTCVAEVPPDPAGWPATAARFKAVLDELAGVGRPPSGPHLENPAVP